MRNSYVTLGATLSASSLVSCFGVMSAGAEPVHFHAWFEGPASVSAGETAIVDLWLQATGPGLADQTPDALASLVLSLHVSGDLEVFGSLDPAVPGDEGVLLFDAGTPDGPTLRDVAGIQNLIFTPPFPSYDNPIHALTFTIATSPADTGNLSLTLGDGDAWGPLRFVWSVNGTLNASDDAGNSLTVDPFSFAVVPAPASVAVLALAGLASTRCRR